MLITNLYIIMFPEKNAIKIGKANDMHNRINTLSKYWGEVNYKQSYYIKGNEQLIFGLEKTLHFLLKNHALNFIYGDGKTEMFDIEALKDALEYINTYVRLNDFESNFIIKGIPSKNIKRNAILIKPKKDKKAELLLFIMNKNSYHLKRINILLNILKKYAEKIVYQCAVNEENIILKLNMKDGIDFERKRLFQNLFSFEYSLANKTGAINLCTCLRYDYNYIEYDISLPKSQAENYFDAYLYYSFQKIKKGFEELMNS